MWHRFHLSVVIQQNLLVWLVWLILDLFGFSHVAISSLFAYFVLESFIFRLIKLSIFLLVLFKWIVAKFLNLLIQHILSKIFVDFRISDFHHRFLRVFGTGVIVFNNFVNLRVSHVWEMSFNVVIRTLAAYLDKLIILILSSFFEYSGLDIVG